MAGYFDEGYYLKSKLAQLQAVGEKDANGNAYDPNSLLQAIHDAGMTPESHYEIHGRTEKLNPNAYFNEVEYLEAKLAQVNSVGETDPDGKPYTPATLIAAIEAAGMTAIEHYEKFGGREMDAKGNLINPSNAFDANAYATAKLAELMKVEPEKWAGKTAKDVVEAIAEAGMTPVSHYDQYGAAEAAAAKIALVQTVPVAARVANDPARAEVTGENVPSNYNAPTPPPATVAAENATPVIKPADMGAKVPADVSPAVTVPSKPVLTEKDAGYMAPPANLVDTNDKPVVPPTTSNTGGVTDNWITVDTSNGSGTITTPDGKPGGTLPGGTITPGGDGGIVIPPDVKPIPPVDPTPDPTPDPKPDPVDPTPPTPTPTFTAEVDATTHALTFGGTATGDITYTDNNTTVTFTQSGISKTITSTELAALTSVTIETGESLTVNDLKGFGASGVAFHNGTVNVTASTGANTFTLENAKLGTFADASGTDTITVKGNVDLSGAALSGAAKPNLVLATGTSALTNTLTIAESLIGTVERLDGTATDTNHLIVKTTGTIDAKAVTLVAANVKVIDDVTFSSTTGAVALNLDPTQMNELQKANLGDGKISGVTEINVAGTNPANNAAVTYDLADFAAPTAGLKVDIKLADNWGSALTINGGAGNENVSVSAAGTATGVFTVNLNGGNDTLTLTDSKASQVKFGAESKFDGGTDGTDTLKLAGDWSGSSLDKADFADIGGTVKGLASNFEVLDLSGMTISAANELLIRTTTAGINKIIGTNGDDTIGGRATVNSVLTEAAAAATLAGDEGADWVIGGTLADTLYGGEMVGATDANYTASADSASLTTNAKFMTSMNGNTTHAAGGNGVADYLTADAFKTLDKANILEGRGGDDKLMASSAKDVFLFQTGGTKEGEPARDDELTFKELGADTIYGFDLKTDKLFIMDQDAENTGNTGATTGARGFSTDWQWTNHKLTALVKDDSPAISDDPVTLTWIDANHTEANITISKSIPVTSQNTNEGADLVIHLVGITGFTEGMDVDNFFTATV